MTTLTRRSKARPRGRVEDLGQGRWRIRVSLGKDANGKRLYAFRTVRGSAADAKRALTELLRSQDTGVSPLASRETVDEWVNAWLTHHCTDISARTRSGYQDVLRRYLSPDLRGRRLSALTPTDVQRWVNELASTNLSPSTVRSAHAALRTCLTDALRLDKVTRNVAKGTVLPKRVHSEMLSLTAEQAQRFLRGVEDTPFRALFVLWLHTGLRNSELAALTWDDLVGNTLHVRRALAFSGKGTRQAVGPTKTGTSRSIPLADHVMTVLKEHRREQVAHIMQYRDIYRDDRLMFSTSRGGYLCFQNIQRRFFKPLLASLSLPNIRMYDLRHTCATLLFSAGENLKVVQERLGHSTPMLTLSTYTHVLPGQQAQASDRLQAILRVG